MLIRTPKEQSREDFWNDLVSGKVPSEGDFDFTQYQCLDSQAFANDTRDLVSFLHKETQSASSSKRDLALKYKEAWITEVWAKSYFKEIVCKGIKIEHWDEIFERHVDLGGTSSCDFRKVVKDDFNHLWSDKVSMRTRSSVQKTLEDLEEELQEKVDEIADLKTQVDRLTKAMRRQAEVIGELEEAMENKPSVDLATEVEVQDLRNQVESLTNRLATSKEKGKALRNARLLRKTLHKDPVPDQYGQYLLNTLTSTLTAINVHWEKVARPTSPSSSDAPDHTA